MPTVPKAPRQNVLVSYEREVVGSRQRLAEARYGQTLRGVVFDGLSLTSVGVADVLWLDRCSFVAADLRQATLDGAHFKFCDLRDADLRGASLRGPRSLAAISRERIFEGRIFAMRGSVR